MQGLNQTYDPANRWERKRGGRSLAKFKYWIYTGDFETSDIITIPDVKLQDKTKEEIDAIVEADLQAWLKHNLQTGWDRV